MNMTTTQRINKITALISSADAGLLEKIENVIRNYRKGDNTSVLTDEQKQTLDQRLAKHKANPKAGRSWGEIKTELSAKYGI